VDLLLADSFLVILSPFIDLHAIDGSGEWMSHRSDGLWSPQLGAQTAVLSTRVAAASISVLAACRSAVDHAARTSAAYLMSSNTVIGASPHFDLNSGLQHVTAGWTSPALTSTSW